MFHPSEAMNLICTQCKRTAVDCYNCGRVIERSLRQSNLMKAFNANNKTWFRKRKTKTFVDQRSVIAKSSQKLRSQNDLESDHTIVLTHFHCRSIVSRFNGWKNCMLRIAIVKLIKINLQFQRFPQHSSIWNESEIFAWNEFRIFIVVRWYQADYAVLTAECLIGFSYNCLHFLSPVCCELRLVADRIWFSHEKHN